MLGVPELSSIKSWEIGSIRLLSEGGIGEAGGGGREEGGLGAGGLQLQACSVAPAVVVACAGLELECSVSQGDPRGTAASQSHASRA